MIRTARIAAACVLALSASVSLAADEPAGGEGKTVHATVIGLDGNAMGMITLQQTPAGVLLSTDLKGLPQGEHGFHFHEKGVCDPAAKFKTSGGHFAAGMPEHGLMVMDGPHGGDMPNQYVGPDGVLKTQVLNTGVTLTPGPKSLLDADGSALVIHAGQDDYTSQPSGNAGGRIACAVISAGE
ncbi:superoxide dismutase family protein [Novosphingobium beihaiensis]|uniref:Superoxide dismutase [Cu-Zn] n=1 Tax=Novosphingobium beihaiensis TaxID=2930389 RepID=A0ABT0BJH9_9SPHN|nr:superoxide dismutase family protein [Novosphingobium beihaiensis]MCJ2185197.1 superoxide dismutase family protein [Novosphingobium beihaiensis]